MQPADAEPAPEMPPPSVGLTILAHTLRVLEEDVPGFTDRLLASIEDEATRAEIVRLRGPKTAPEMLRMHREAATWLTQVRLVTLARIARLKFGPKKKKR